MIPLWPRLPQEFLWGSGLSGTLQGAGGVDGLLSMSERQPDESWQVSYAISDANGNVMKLVDSETLAMVAEYEYGPFGELLRAEGARAKANPFRFSSKYQDDESGLLYYGYRYYDAALGRWLNRDPIEEEGGSNLYAIVQNLVINAYDFLGLTFNDPLGEARSWISTIKNASKGIMNGGPRIRQEFVDNTVRQFQPYYRNTSRITIERRISTQWKFGDAHHCP